MPLAKGRAKDKEALLLPAEIKAYRSMCAQIQWVGRESRAEVAGSASLLNSALPSPTVADAQTGIKVCKFLRATAAQSITIWPLAVHTLNFVTISDAGGPGTARRGGARGAWLVLVAEPSLKHNRRAKVSALAWRSTRLKRAVASTVAAETLALSAAVAEAQWLQVLYRSLIFQDVVAPEWHLEAGPFSCVLSRDCELAQSMPTLSVVDAKSVFDTLSKNTSGSKVDRRNVIEIAVMYEIRMNPYEIRIGPVR